MILCRIRPIPSLRADFYWLKPVTLDSDSLRPKGWSQPFLKKASCPRKLGSRGYKKASGVRTKPVTAQRSKDPSAGICQEDDWSPPK